MKVLVAFRTAASRGVAWMLGRHTKLVDSAKLCAQFSSGTNVVYPRGRSMSQGNEVAIPISTKEDTEAKVMKAA